MSEDKFRENFANEKMRLKKRDIDDLADSFFE